MNLVFSDHAWEDYQYWQQNDPKILQRVHQLLTETKRQPFSGIGKPELLKLGYKGYWSRRITDEHRLVYKVVEDSIDIVQLRYHD